MSFDVICTGCGAPSGPSVGICPFCKTVMASKDSQAQHSIDLLMKYYTEGRLERALSLGSELKKAKPELLNDLGFVLTLVKLMIESEAPSSRIKSLLAQAHLSAPQNTDVLDYLDIVEAKNCLKRGVGDSGEVLLRSVLRRSPNNAHAHFILGSHLFWIEADSISAISHLEACVRLHPVFLRAWGCLGAIYKKMGHTQLAQMAFQRCAAIETNPGMKEFFQQQAKA